jgi:hypothetical protein
MPRRRTAGGRRQGVIIDLVLRLAAERGAAYPSVPGVRAEHEPDAVADEAFAADRQ